MSNFIKKSYLCIYNLGYYNLNYKSFFLLIYMYRFSLYTFYS